MRDDQAESTFNIKACFAEGSAALFSEFVCYPMHTIWTLQQEISANEKVSFIQTCQRFNKNTLSYWSLYKGFSISGTSAVLGIYPYLLGAHYAKLCFGDNHIGEFMQGVVAQTLAASIWLPATHIVELEQATITCKVNAKFQELSAFDKSKIIWKQSGLRGFYRSAWAQIGANAIDDALGFWLRARILSCFSTEQQKQLSPQLFSTFMGFSAAAVITTPVSIVQSRLRLHEANPTVFPDKKFLPAFKRLYQQGGFRGFFNGATTAALYGGITALPVVSNAVLRS